MAKRSTRIVLNKSFPLSQVEAAMLSNVEPETLTRWAREENPPPRDPDGTYPAREYGLWMMKVQSVRRGPGRGDNRPFAPINPVTIQKPSDPENENKLEAETRKTIAQADKLEMENAVAAGLLIPAAEIEPALGEMVSKVRNRMLKLPVALAPLVLGDDDLYSIQQKLRDGVNDALSEVSVDWKSGVSDDVEQDD